ncbi:MAG: TSUP family transporter, partial [Candidatus Acidiferrales bacterium]
YSQHLAQGTSLLLQLPPIGLGALIFYWKRDRVDLRAGLVCAAGFLLGGYFGSYVALEIPKDTLQGMFGCFLMMAAALLFRQGRSSATAGAVAPEDAQP